MASLTRPGLTLNFAAISCADIFGLLLLMILIERAKAGVMRAELIGALGFTRLRNISSEIVISMICASLGWFGRS